MQIGPIFLPDSSIDQTQYYWFQKGFNEEELEWLNNLKDFYKSDDQHIKFINIDDKSFWLFNKMMGFASEANNAIWKFNLNSVIDSMKYIEYYPENNLHYDWHMDIGPSPINHRKISLVTLLSDPNEYEGGDLELWTGGKFITLPRIKGCTFIFPSFLLHRVTPVTKGLRQSLVLWVGGESYK